MASPKVFATVRRSWYLGRRIAIVVEQSRRRRLEALAVVGQRFLQPLAIGGGLLVRQRQRRAPRRGPRRFAFSPSRPVRASR
jgi:hypothetical protein